jgi:hypothetical protein
MVFELQGSSINLPAKVQFNMKKSLLCLGLILGTIVAQAQGMFIQDINGRPIFENGYTEIEGSPYLKDAWARGTVKAKHNGKTYELAKMRYDAYKDELEYEENEKAYRFSGEITEFATTDGVFRNGFPVFESLTARSFYQVVYDGKVKLLKRTVARVQTEKLYSSATQTKRFVKEEFLYLLKNGVFTRLKKDKKALLEALGEKQDELEAFIKDQKLKLSKEEDILRVLEKYEGQ